VKADKNSEIKLLREELGEVKAEKEMLHQQVEDL